MSDIVIKEDSVFIKPLGFGSWFAAISVGTFFLLLLKASIFQQLTSDSNPLIQISSKDLFIGIITYLAVIGILFYFLWEFALHGLVREEVVIQDGEFVWKWRWLFLKHVVCVPAESISDLAWYHSCGSDNLASYAYFRINGGRRIKRARGYSLDDLKKLAEHLEPLLPHGNKLSKKTLKFYRELAESEERSGKKRAHYDRIKEQEEPGLFGLRLVTWGRMGLLVGIIFFGAAKYFNKDELFIYTILATVTILLLALIMRPLNSLRIARLKKNSAYKRATSRKDGNLANAILSFLVGVVGGFVLQGFLGLVIGIER